ncbi:Cys-tRNA(Pro) deacylase [Ruminococcus sp.]|uniref:Cys-tRNA(Pro) deacylase n=1 Tax=Ruminococcus sp. TaxID=41978 RepID=UPI0025E2DEF0|nr:Cys-tRNA(Pro) deacylase [Ruminococcus sp.]MBQ9542396.1 Cys-tRNA(Pro) deacylase [Ruminococcus sp.]
MAKEKDVKTNAMRILDRNKVSYKVNTYECEEFIDGVQIADMLGQPYEMTYKTLVAQGRSGGYFVFVIPIAEELDMKKAARSVGEKSVELIHVKDINKITGYIRGGCTPLGMKKQFPTVVDDTAKALDEIIISGGRLGSQIFLSPKDLVKVTGGKFEQIIFDGQQD